MKTETKKLKKILVVDDSSFQQKMMAGMLAGRYEALRAASGEEALEIYEKEQPDMILTDLVMPGMSGLELQRELYDRFGEQVPIIFVTANTDEENEAAGLEGGAMDYIQKPFTKEHLLRRVDNFMRQVEKIEGLKTFAEKDAMTGLLNKAYAQKTLEETCRRESGTLMMVDLDSFKLVNDIYGHSMGDKVLIRFADILRGVIRASDVAGRMGGDEFVLFCRDVKDEALVAQKTETLNELILAAAKEFMGADMGIPLGASVGAVAVPEEGRDFADLYRKADKALYEVKRNGRHGYYIYRGDNAAGMEEEETPAAASVRNVRLIMDERGGHRGALQLSMEAFTSVYRFELRCIENYHRTAALALFTVGGSGETAEAFGEVLKNSLRRSDAFAKNGKTRYIALLSQVGEEDAEIIFERIMSNWTQDERGGAEVLYEFDLIHSGM